MALSNLNNDNVTRLFNMLATTEKTDYNNLLEIRRNYSTYSKLELIAKQIDFLKKEATNIIENHNLNIDLETVECNFRKAPGTYYYIYEKDNKKILSIISPNEGIIYDNFLLKVYYDYDNLFHIMQ